MSAPPVNPPPAPFAAQPSGQGARDSASAASPRRHTRRWYLPRWLHVTLLLLCVALIGVGTWVASQQAPHPDPFRRIGNWDANQADWWAYPLERNAFKRTLVQGGLRDVFHLPGGEHVWVVGEGGLILHSGDGGRTWAQQNPRVDKTAGSDADSVASAFTHVSEPMDWTGWLPSAQAATVDAVNDATAKAVRQAVPQVEKNLQRELEQVQKISDTYSPYVQQAQPPAKAPAPPSQLKVIEARQAPGKVPSAAPAASVAASGASAAGATAAVPVDPWQATLRAVHFVDARRGWAIGEHGVILSTRNGGARWRKLPLPAGLGDVTLRALAFSPDAQQAWIVGDAGTFLHSADGGATWQRQDNVAAKPNDMLTGVSMDAEGHGFVAGLTGAAYSTQDGGKTWGSITTVITANNGEQPSVLEVLAVSVAGGHAWSVGVDGGVERYREGEGSTLMHPLSLKTTLRGVSAVAGGADRAGQQVWAVGDNGLMLHTANGGDDWTQLPLQTTATLRAVRFDADGRRGWVVGDGGTLLATTDGGQTWVWQAGPDVVFEDVAFTSDGQRGWAIGPYGWLLVSDDAGASWVPQTLKLSIPASAADSKARHTPGQLHALQIASDGQRGWAAGDNLTIVSTADGGATWVARLIGSAYAPWRKVRLSADGQHGWAAGRMIMSTKNGGQNWSLSISWPADAVAAATPVLDFWGAAATPDGQHGWIVGAQAILARTTNGGDNWTHVQVLHTSPTPLLTDVAMTDNNQRGWIVGEHGTVLTTIDGGLSWSPQSSGTAAFLSSVAVAGNGTAVLAAGGDVLLRSRNGGLSWDAQPSPGGSARLVRFNTDGQHGWLAGDGANLQLTADRGVHWQPAAVYERHWAPWYAAMLLLTSLALAVLLGYVESGAQMPAAMGAGTVAYVLSSDQPVSDKADDRLGFRPAVEALSAFIRNASTEPRITLAVTGEWGSGKSSIMRMLQTDLQQAGFRTAWFNAWHHQQEGRQLAALFNVIKQQAVPQLWSQPVAWLRVRSRLIWGRGAFYQLVALAMAVVLAVAAGDLFSVGRERALDNLKLNVKHYVLQEHQTIVTGGTLDKLDPFRRAVAKNTVIAAVAAAASAPDLLAAAPSAITTTASTAETASHVDAIAQALNQQPPAAGKTAADPCDNAALKLQLQKAVPVRPEVFCYMKRALLWEPSGDNPQCGDTRALPPERHCVFARPQDLVATVKAHIQGDKLRPSEEEAILDAAETLPPPVVFPWLQRSLLGGLVGFIVLLFTKGWTIGGLQILEPIKNLLKLGTGEKTDPDKEPTGTVEHCRAEFGMVTDALEGRLVIFIDDLDRCTADTVNSLMELTNYLVDIGRCFVVIGAAMDRVMLCIKPPVEPADPQNAAQAAADYAQAYLRKLVHIELPVPPTRSRLHELMDEPPAPPAARRAPRWRRVLQWLWGLMLFEVKWLRRIVWVCALVGLTWLAFKTGARLQANAEGKAQPIDLPAAVADAVAGVRPDTAASGAAPAPAPMDGSIAATGPDKTPTLLSPGASAPIEPRWWWALGLLLLFTGLGWNWVRRYRARLTVVLGGVIRSHDSNQFILALRLWKDVVIAHDPTPRHVKRFYNRTRLFAAYEQRDGAARKQPAAHEAHLVMMAALHHTSPAHLQTLREGILGFGDFSGKPLSPNEQERRLLPQLQNWPEALKRVLAQHIALFGGLPSIEQIARFEEHLSGLRVS